MNELIVIKITIKARWKKIEQNKSQLIEEYELIVNLI